MLPKLNSLHLFETAQTDVLRIFEAMFWTTFLTIFFDDFYPILKDEILDGQENLDTFQEKMGINYKKYSQLHFSTE